MDLGVRGRSYIIVGGSRGMGLEAARVLAAEGASLSLIGRTRETLEAAAGELAAAGAPVAAFPADATRADEIDAAIAAAIARFGAPRGLLVTSGLTDRNGTVLEISDADWEANFQDVLMGTVRPCRAVLPHMLAAGGGNIVTTAAYSVRAPKAFIYPYAALKAAVVNFTKNLCKTYGPQGVRANCVCPGAFATARVSERIEQAMAEEGLDRRAAGAHVLRDIFKMPVALERPGEAHEAGELMAFLLSERAAYLTGAAVNIDGGTDF
jgi:NAD(P)-dependent dehydrogenase (short-subunit alcohol dehydrogenase family)